MGTTTIGSIVQRAANALYDDTSIRWPEAELITFLSDGQRDAVLLRPEIHPENKVMALVEGSRQTIPTDGHTFITCIRNMGAASSITTPTPGRAVREAKRNLLDNTRSDWHHGSSSIVAKQFVFDNRDKRHFYVFPPQPNPPGSVEIVYSKSPKELRAYATKSGSSWEVLNNTGVRQGSTYSSSQEAAAHAAQVDVTLAETQELDDIYQPALHYYIMARAYQKDLEGEGGDMNKAQRFEMLFRERITGFREQSAQRLHPDQIEQRVAP